MIKKALISVADKSGIVDFAKELSDLGVEIISTGGTANTLRQAGIPVTTVSKLTGFPEIMDGRVKTLHPLIYGGILGQRDSHSEEAKSHGVEWIDLVVCNLYPFAETIKKPETSLEQALENIDIGGVTMIRAAAKNFKWVGVLVEIADYSVILNEIRETGDLSLDTRKKLAAKAFAYTAQYDTLIQQYLNEDEYPDRLNLTFNRLDTLRYGENPHQSACVYEKVGIRDNKTLNSAKIQGKPLSYNNTNDADSAINCLLEFREPTCVVVKHVNPCGVATHNDINEAFINAFLADETSSFGGIVALNRRCTQTIAEKLSKVFIEILIAKGFDEEALSILQTKPNVRILDLETHPITQAKHKIKSINGGLLIQSSDVSSITEKDLQLVTQTEPKAPIETILFGWKVLKHVKSNAILIARDQITLGIGTGQTSRVDAVEIAISKTSGELKNAVLASDAFFPFKDSIDRIAQTGIKTIIQPGGSIRDREVINACNEHGIAMVFTGVRCFNH